MENTVDISNIGLKQEASGKRWSKNGTENIPGIQVEKKWNSSEEFYLFQKRSTEKNRTIWKLNKEKFRFSKLS